MNLKRTLFVPSLFLAGLIFFAEAGALMAMQPAGEQTGAKAGERTQSQSPGEAVPSSATAAGAVQETARAQETAPGPEASSRVQAALQKSIDQIAEQPLYRLQYSLKPDSEWVWDCEQSTSTSTRMAGHSEKSTSRTRWSTRWQVEAVNEAGQYAFSSGVQDFSLWQQIDDRPPVTFSSSDDPARVPDEFVTIADSLRPAPSRFVVAPNGRVVTRDSATDKQLIGFGEITIPFPDEAIPVGFRWFVSRPLMGKDENQVPVRVASRVSYELSRVVGQRAYLSFRTEILTPGLSAAVQSQILQHLARGYIIFDMSQGIVVYRETEWNEKVQSFAGPDSYLMYVARSTQRLRTGDLPAARPAEAADRVVGTSGAPVSGAPVPVAPVSEAAEVSTGTVHRDPAIQPASHSAPAGGTPLPAAPTPLMPLPVPGKQAPASGEVPAADNGQAASETGQSASGSGAR